VNGDAESGPEGAVGARRLEGRRALLVGAATGIGRAAANRLAREGALVAIADLNADDGDKTARAIEDQGGKAWFFPVEVRTEADVADMVGGAVDALGGLDILVNSAGVLEVGPIETFPSDAWARILEVNLTGQFFVLKHAVPHLKEQGGGSVINIASAAGLKSGPGETAYAASKGGIIAFSRTLAMELAADNIRVNALCPGFVDTPFNDPATEYAGGPAAVDEFVRTFIPLGRQGEPKEIAGVIAFLASDDSSFLTGQAVLVDGGMM
jgi:NAD(P)-dependent dehydrogenase (short-subunit alcohol dehydrogenase family)